MALSAEWGPQGTGPPSLLTLERCLVAGPAPSQILPKILLRSFFGE